NSYIWSPVATKNISLVNQSGIDSALFWFCGNACGTVAPAEMQHFWYNTFNGPGEATGDRRPQNVNGVRTVNLNQWYCLEQHVRMNSTPSTHDGILEGWIDGVQHWNYQNQLIDMSPTPNLFTGWATYPYWNCD